MNNKINTFDQGLSYLNQASKEGGVFAQTKLEALPWLLFSLGSLGKLLKASGKAKEVIAFAGKKMRQSPWLIVVSVAGLALLAGMASRKILAGKQEFKDA